MPQLECAVKGCVGARQGIDAHGRTRVVGELCRGAAQIQSAGHQRAVAHVQLAVVRGVEIPQFQGAGDGDQPAVLDVQRPPCGRTSGSAAHIHAAVLGPGRTGSGHRGRAIRTGILPDAAVPAHDVAAVLDGHRAGAIGAHGELSAGGQCSVHRDRAFRGSAVARDADERAPVDHSARRDVQGSIAIEAHRQVRGVGPRPGHGGRACRGGVTANEAYRVSEVSTGIDVQGAGACIAHPRPSGSRANHRAAAVLDGDRAVAASEAHDQMPGGEVAGHGQCARAVVAHINFRAHREALSGSHGVVARPAAVPQLENAVERYV